MDDWAGTELVRLEDSPLSWEAEVYAPSKMRKDFESKTWLKIRAAVLKRDGDKCMSCRTRSNLTIHHKIPRHEGGKDIMKNLEVLCEHCHDVIECGGDPIPSPTSKEAGKDWREWVYGGKRNNNPGY